MNIKLKTVFILLFICILIPFNNNLNAQIGVRSVGVNLGYYSPSMDYWNDNALSTWSNQFSGNFYGNVNVEVKVIKIVNVRVGIGYWNQELTESGIQYGDELRSDKVSIQMLPLSFDLIIRSPEELSTLYGFYGGIGSGMNFISMEYTTSIPSMGDNVQDESGQNYMFHLVLGGDYKIMHNIAVGAEFLYTFASYNQEVIAGTETVEKKVSVSGPKIMATFKYLF